MPIYTRKGDTGYTRLADATRVRKTDLRIQAVGAADELNAALGLARSLSRDPGVQAAVEAIQRQLFRVCSALSSPAVAQIDLAWITQFERAIDAADGELPPQTDWILPGATPGSGALHVARVTCRRAERAAVALLEQEEPSGSDTAVLQYLNRLSDYLHILARLEDHRTLVRRVAERVRAELDPTLTEADCDRILAAAEARARAIGVPMVIAVVDAGGNLKLFKRMDGALLASVDIAVNKAYTSAAVRLPTREVGKLAQPGAPLFGIESSGRIVAFAGGVPISRAGAVVGGLGVSGGTVEQDEDVAMAGLNGLI